MIGKKFGPKIGRSELVTFISQYIGMVQLHLLQLIHYNRILQALTSRTLLKYHLLDCEHSEYLVSHCTTARARQRGHHGRGELEDTFGR